MSLCLRLLFDYVFCCWTSNKPRRDEKQKTSTKDSKTKTLSKDRWRTLNGSRATQLSDEQVEIIKRKIDLTSERNGGGEAREENVNNKQYERNLINSSQVQQILDEFLESNEKKALKTSQSEQYNVNIMEESKQSQAQGQRQASNGAITHEVHSIDLIGSSGDERQFRTRTANRRHLDFDPEYDLSDPSAANRTKWSGAFHFIQAADSQFGMIDSYVHKRTEPGWKEEIELCQQLIDTCNHMEPKPLFLIICGDLVDAWPPTEIRHQQVVDFKRVFAQLRPDIPLVCVCGNHDVGDQPTMSGVLEFRRTFGDDYFYFTKNDVLFIVINSQFYQHREFVQDYAAQQDQWLESLLEKCKLFKYSIVFEHIPWFLQNHDEDDDYFNIKKEVRLTWLRKFKEAGVSKIMCGHYHRNAGGWYDGLELIVTSAIGAQCGNDRSGARIVRVLDNSIEHQYYAIEDIPRKVQLS